MRSGAGERSTQLAARVREDAIEALLRECLVRGDRERPLARLTEEAKDRAHARDAEEHHGRQGRYGRQLEGRLGHDAQRPFTADEELLEIEPGVVLLEGAADLEDLARREHD